MHESEKWKWSHSVVSDSSWPHGLHPTRLLCPWDFPGNSTGVGCHCLLQILSYYVSKYTLFLKILYGFSIICLPNIFVCIMIFKKQWKRCQFFFFKGHYYFSKEATLWNQQKGRKKEREGGLTEASNNFIISLQGLRSRAEFWSR